MDEDLSWRARLAKANINILDIRGQLVSIEFTYHPKPGVFKWCKTLVTFKEGMKANELADKILEDVLSLRKELEA